MNPIVTLIDRHIHAVAFVLSTLFSLLALATDQLINHDGIWYVSAAKAFLREGFPASVEVFYWPFFSVLIAGTHKVTGLSLENSAHLLDVGFAGISCVLFLKLYEEVAESRSALPVAAVIILGFVGINKYRPDIMRDFGYWCFYFAALLALLRYYKNPSWRDALAWQIFAILATLFRIEGVVLTLLAPLVMLTTNSTLSAKVRSTIPLYSLSFIGIIGATILVGMDSGTLETIEPYLDLLALSTLSDQFTHHVKLIGDIFYYDGWNLDKYYGTLSISLLAAMLAYLMIKIASCLGLPYTVVLAYGSKKYSIRRIPHFKFVAFLCSILFLFLLFYTLQKPAVSPRYTTTLSFLLLIFIVHFVSIFVSSPEKSGAQKRVIWIVFAILIAHTADTLISTPSHSKDHLIQAGQWLQHNTTPESKMYANDEKVIYFADRTRIMDHLISISEARAIQEKAEPLASVLRSLYNDNSTATAYVALEIKHDDEQEHDRALDLLNQVGSFDLLESFRNQKNDRVLVYGLSLKR